MGANIFAFFGVFIMAKTESGRYLAYKPEDMPVEAWEEILSSWENGLSDREASFRASRDNNFYITEAQIREIYENDVRVADLRDFLRTDLVSQAKLNIAKSIREGSVSTTKWFLERKAPEEYSSKSAVAFEGAVVAVSMDEKEAEMDKFLEGLGISKEKKQEEAPIAFLGETDDAV